MNNKNSMKMRVPGAKQAIEKMKYEIANEFGVNLGPDTTSRANGSVGGEITISVFGFLLLNNSSKRLSVFPESIISSTTITFLPSMEPDKSCFTLRKE